MRLSKIDSLYYLYNSDNEEHRALDAGFIFDQVLNLWYTPHIKVASRLRQYADKRTENYFKSTSSLLSPWSGKLSHSKNKTPYPFQKVSASRILDRACQGKDSYLADDPGLGKSFTLSMVLDTSPGFSLLVIPPFLKLNWESELKDNLKNQKDVALIESNKNIDYDSDILLMPDSLLDNPDILKELKMRHFKWLMVDEAHRFKSYEANRTKILLGGSGKTLSNQALTNVADHIVFASGTPMPNRAIELYPSIKALDHEAINFMNYHAYGRRYGVPKYYKGKTAYTDSANMPHLKGLTRDLFIRHRKADVLKELPPKIERVILLSKDLPNEMKNFELDNIGASYDMKALLEKTTKDPRGVIARHIKKVGLLKVELATEYIMSKVEASQDSFLIFAWHFEVLEKLRNNFKKYRPFFIDGSTSMRDRYSQVKKFQASDRQECFIGNTKAMGVGFTLTKAKRAFIVEPSWEPSTDTQAGDRGHRIGQDKIFEIDYLVFRNSIDEYRVRSQLKKQDNINKIF